MNAQQKQCKFIKAQEEHNTECQQVKTKEDNKVDLAARKVLNTKLFQSLISSFQLNLKIGKKKETI